MCGIAGIVNADQRPVDSEDLNRLIMTQRHRGPDGAKTWLSSDKACGFVHLRLAILDPAARADQPMLSRDGDATIVFNGEIFNFLELRDELALSGATFHTESDTEVLLEAWRCWGPDMLPRLNGMWALAIRDNRSGDLFLARDRFGIKPFLYFHQGNRFAFASEARALLALPFVDSEIDPDVAARLLFEPMGVEASELSLHRQIRKLPAGHYAFLRKNELVVRRWWTTVDHLVEPPRTMADAAEQFRDLFLDSIRLRMRSDVRIGTCLSGGFDSTAVVSGMAHIAAATNMSHLRESDDWRHAFVASFPGIGHDETPQAREAAAFAGIRPVIEQMSEDEGPDDADQVLEAIDDVYISLPTAIWKIYRKVNELGIRVSLDGHGADELIGAYFSPDARLGFHLRSRMTNQAGSTRMNRRIMETAKLALFRARGESFLRGSGMRPPEPLPIAALADRLPDHWGLLNRRLYGMFHGNILPTILRNFDRLSMAHGVEVRMPFMDWRLVTFAMSLPEKMKADNGITKVIARQAMRGIMPESIRTSPRKVGFNSQMPEWLNGSLGKWAERSLAENSNDAFDAIVDRRALIAKVRRLSARREWDWVNTGRIWPYINLNWYLSARLGQAASATPTSSAIAGLR